MDDDTDTVADEASEGTWLPVKDAAPRLGLTLDQLRRRLRRGELRGRQVPTPTGHSWLVWIGGEMAVSDVGHPVSDDGRRTADGVYAASDDGRRTSDTAPPSAAPQMALEAVRAAGMAQYTRELLEPLHARLESQAERIGRLEAELEQSRVRVAELERIQLSAERPETQRVDAPEWPERRSWWQRLVFG